MVIGQHKFLTHKKNVRKNSKECLRDNSGSVKRNELPSAKKYHAFIAISYYVTPSGKNADRDIFFYLSIIFQKLYLYTILKMNTFHNCLSALLHRDAFDPQPRGINARSLEDLILRDTRLSHNK